MTIGCLCLRRRLFLLVLRPTAALRFLPVPPDFPLRASQSDFQRLSGRRLRRTPPVIDFGPSRAPSRPVLRPLLTSHGEPSSAAPFGAASVRSSRVGARSFPSCSCLIYGSCSSAQGFACSLLQPAASRRTPCSWPWSCRCRLPRKLSPIGTCPCRARQEKPPLRAVLQRLWAGWF